MTLAHLRDAFVMEYKLECMKNSVREINFADRQIAYFISKAQQDMINRLKIAKTYTDVSLTAVTTYTEYSLPTNFGAIANSPSISGRELEVVPITDIPTDDITAGDPQKIAIYFNGTDYKIALSPIPSSTATLRVWYYPDTGYFIPGGTGSQNWGTFTAETFTGNVKFPDKYIKAIIDFMVGEIFPQRKAEYENEINKLKATGGSTIAKFKYRLGY